MRRSAGALRAEDAAAALPVARLPKLLLEEVGNEAGGGDVDINDGQTVRPVIQRVEWSDVVRDALAVELGRMGWPMTESRVSAGARMRATVKLARAEMHLPGFSVPVKETVVIDLVLKRKTAPRCGRAELEGVGHDLRCPVARREYGSNKAANEALDAAIARLGPLLADERPWDRLASNAAARRRRRGVPAPARARAPAAGSDIDQLPPAGAVNPHSYAVVIGIERYRGKLPNADFASGDARLAAEYFKRVLGVPEDNVALLTDEYAGKNDFEKYIEALVAEHGRKGRHASTSTIPDMERRTRRRATPTWSPMTAIRRTSRRPATR